jgi:hypothetical protein
VLTFPTHERWESGLALTGHRFWAVRAQGIKDWDRTYAPLPENYVLLDPNKGNNQLPAEIDFDVVLSQNKFGQFQIAKSIADQLHLPLVSIEHTLPMPNWGQEVLDQLKAMRGNVNLFISAYSRAKWGWADKEAGYVHHGVDTDIFKPTTPYDKRHSRVLSVVNDWINRDWCCGFRLWQETVRGLEVQVVGKTPGLSEPARDVYELRDFYAEAGIFLNTSTVSPVPTALLEAMSAGCAVVSTNNCMIPEVINSGENGLLGNTAEDLRRHLDFLLMNPDARAKLGAAARKTIEDHFGMKKFVDSWDMVLRFAANLPFKGFNR